LSLTPTTPSSPVNPILAAAVALLVPLTLLTTFVLKLVAALLIELAVIGLAAVDGRLRHPEDDPGTFLMVVVDDEASTLGVRVSEVELGSSKSSFSGSKGRVDCRSLEDVLP